MSSPSNRKTGHVKFFNSQKGFGFIIPNEPVDGAAQAEIFVHHTSIYNNGGFRSLAEGEEVEFDLVQGPKGLQATSVTGPNGGPVKGDPRAGRSNNMNQFNNQFRGAGYWQQQGNFNGNGNFRQGFNQQYSNQYAPNGQFFYSPQQFQGQNQQAFTTQNANQYIQATQAGFNQYPANMNMNTMNTMNAMNAMNMNTMNAMNTMNINMNTLNNMNGMNTMTNINNMNSMNAVNSVNTMNNINTMNTMNTLNNMNTLNTMNTLDRTNTINNMNHDTLPSSIPLSNLNSANSINGHNVFSLEHSANPIAPNRQKTTRVGSRSNTKKITKEEEARIVSGAKENNNNNNGDNLPSYEEL